MARTSRGPGRTVRASGVSGDQPARIEQLRNWIGAEGHIRVADAAERLRVSPESVRRYLDLLERDGVARRVHGGAVAAAEPPAVAGPAPDVQPVAGAVWRLLPRTGSILLGAGAVSAALGGLIRECPDDLSRLTVLTDSVAAAATASQRDDISVYCVGGQVNCHTFGQFGAWTLSGLRRLHADVMVSCPDGIHAQDGLTRESVPAATVAAAELACAPMRIVAAPAQTLGVSALAGFAGLGAVDAVVCCSGQLDRELRQALEEAGARTVEAG